MSNTEEKISQRTYLSGRHPMWCPGCGHFSILASLARTLATMGIDREKTAVVSGIGCSSRLPGYMSTYGFHTLHGRALPTAIGLAVSRPDLTVLATGGDGDMLSIGTNHFVHAARRNVNMTVIVMDNEVYGLTKGQTSPTSQRDWGDGKMIPTQGTGFEPIHPLEIALAAGVGFVARGYSGDPKGLKEIMRRAIEYPGFSVVQILSYCITFRRDLISWKKDTYSWEGQPLATRAEAFSVLSELGQNAMGIFFEDKTLPSFSPYIKDSVDVFSLKEKFSI